MPWWGWLVIGFGLAAAELMGAEAAYYLIFIGFAAIFMGLIGLAGLSLPVWGQWLLFSVMSIASMVLFRRKLYNRFHRAPYDPSFKLVGQILEAPADVAPGKSCQVKLRGTTWKAENVGAANIMAGQRVRIVATDSTLLQIERRTDP